MIRSRTLNALVFVIGLTFGVAGVTGGIGALRDMRWAAEVWLFPLLFSVLWIVVAVWCCVGAIQNLRHRSEIHAEPLTPARRATHFLLCGAALGVLLLISGSFLAARNGSTEPLGLRLHQVGALSILAILLAIPFLAAWNSRSTRKNT